MKRNSGDISGYINWNDVVTTLVSTDIFSCNAAPYSSSVGLKMRSIIMIDHRIHWGQKELGRNH